MGTDLARKRPCQQWVRLVVGREPLNQARSTLSHDSYDASPSARNGKAVSNPAVPLPIDVTDR